MGKDLFNVSTLTDVDKLAIFNQVLTEMRIQARTTPITAFHELVLQLGNSGILQRCYSQNFDGIQTRDSPNLVDKIVELHGSNNVLTCRVCMKEAPEPAMMFDREMQRTGLVKCPQCVATATQAMQLGKRSRPVGYLTPKILLNEEPVTFYHNGVDLNKLKEIDSQVNLLLVVATSLHSNGLRRLLKEMILTVRQHHGVIVYIDHTPASKALAGLFDIQLQVDVQDWAKHMLVYTGCIVKERQYQETAAVDMGMQDKVIQQWYPNTKFN
ncbi:hypothetical protein FRC08_003105 [Ceratobasidium sp. 394]|nr:hypothetical protein FRC08_003105 [Ceratobasidium sp. 394]